MKKRFGTVKRARREKGKLCKCLFLFLLSLSSVLCGCAASSVPMNEKLLITVLDIGKADAILLQCGGHNVLIDCGEAEDAEKINAALQQKKVKALDLLVLTHSDKDHIGGAASILQNFAVKEVIRSHKEADSESYRALLAALEEGKIAQEKLSEEKKYSFSHLEIRLLPAREKSYADDNDYSIITEAVFGETKFLFAGDAEKARLAEYLETSPGKFDFLKVPHHGRAEDNSAQFFEAVSPEFAVITCSKKNPPDEETLSFLEEIGAQVFLTENGAVQVISDGKKVKVTQF